MKLNSVRLDVSTTGCELSAKISRTVVHPSRVGLFPCGGVEQGSSFLGVQITAGMMNDQNQMLAH